MPIIHINAGDRLPSTPWLDDEGPVIIMVHGFK